MSVCKICGSLDFVRIYQEESQQLSWLTADIAVLCEENSNLLQKIKEINEDLENFDDKSKFYEEPFEDNGSDDELWREELTSLERDIWLQKEVYLRKGLMQQLLSLSQDLSSLQPQHHHPPHHQPQPHLPRHLWGHQTLQWCPPSPASRFRQSKTRRQERLRRWIFRRMPMI